MILTIYQKNEIIAGSIYFFILYFIYSFITIGHVALWDIIYTSIAFIIIICFSTLFANYYSNNNFI